MRAPLLAVAALLAAGCVSPLDDLDPSSLPPVAPPEWWLAAVPWGEGHDHADHAHHAGLSTGNFEVVGFDPLVTSHYGTTVRGMSCGGVGKDADGRKLALAHSLGTDVAFVVADVTDPTAPTMLGEYYLPNVVVWDATITPDGRYAVLGADLFVFGGGPLVLPGADTAPRLVEVQPMFKDYCTGETRAAGPAQYLPVPGVVLVSLEDPTSPQLADWVPQPVIGPHSVTAHEIDGTTWVTASVTNLVHQASYYSLFHVEGGKLAPVSVIRAPGTPPPTALNGHVDVTISKHPGDGKTYAWLANWDVGLAIYDLTDPRAPALVGTWADGEAGNLHNTYALPELRGGRHYTIVGQEVGEPVDLPSGWVYVLDTTDPADPFEVSRWTLPVKPDWDGGLQFSTHYVEVLGDTMFVANYHGGLWAVDVSDLATPDAVGIFVPDRASPAPYEDRAWGPSVGEVIADPETGVLTAWDNAAGVYQLRFDATRPAPSPEPWPGPR